MKKALALLLAALMVITMLAGCGQKEVDITPTEPPKEEPKTEPTPADPGQTAEPKVEEPAVPKPEGEGTLRIASTADVSTLNGHQYSMSRDGDAASFLCIYLYNSYIGDNFKFCYLPELAADVPQKMNDEGTVWQIPLRNDQVWENGDPINADTVMYSYKMLLDPVLLNTRASYFASNTITVLNATEYNAGQCEWEEVGLKKIDDYTVELTTVGGVTANEIMTHFCFNFSMAMVHEATYEAAMNADHTATMYGTSADTFMSAGPFKIKEWVPGCITYEKNPNFVYADKIWVHEVVDRTVSDGSTRLQLFLNGELDYVSLGDEEYQQYKEDPRVISSDATSMKHISVNSVNDKKVLQSDNFRKALYYGTDRTSVASISGGIPAWWIQPLMVVGDLDTGETFRELVEKLHPEYVPENNGYDPVKAVEYFEKALEEAGEDHIDFTIIFSSDTNTYQAASEYLQKAWAELFGADRFHMELQGMPNSQMTAQKKSWISDNNAYEVGWGAWSTSKISPWNGFNVWRGTYAKKNEPWSSDELDELWIKANQTDERFDKANQLEMAIRMEQIMLEEAAIIPVMENKNYYLKADRVTLPTPDNRYVVNAGFGWMYAKVAD